MTMRAIPPCFYDFIAVAEGCRLTAYQDQGGIWTVGYGHTGPEVHGRMTITVDQARAIYLPVDAGVAARRLARVVSEDRILAWTDHEYAAMLSFVFNLGAAPGWTIWKVANAGRTDQITTQMMRFDKGRVNGKLVEVPGLKHRRLAEVALWNQVDAHVAASLVANAPVQPPPSSVTRLADTPPTPAPSAKPIATSKTFLGGLVTAGLGALEVAKGGLTNIQSIALPQIEHSALVANIAEYAATGLVFVGIAVAAIRWMDERAKHQ